MTLILNVQLTVIAILLFTLYWTNDNFEWKQTVSYFLARDLNKACMYTFKIQYSSEKCTLSFFYLN